MIRISQVEMEGFRGFRKRTRFDFPNGFAVLTGRNGSGKSTVFDAIDFAFTGTISKFDVRGAKGGGLDDHIWWVGSGKSTEHFVSVGLQDDDGNSWSIRRLRNGRVTGLDKVAKLLCTTALHTPNWETALVQTSLIRDEHIAAMSLDMTEQARFNAVRAALGTNDPSTHLERFRRTVAAAEQAKADQQDKHTRSHEDLGRALTMLTEIRSQADRQTQLAQAEESLARLFGVEWRTDPKRLEVARDALVEARQKLNQSRTAISEAGAVRARYTETQTETFASQLQGLLGRIQKLQTDRVQLETQRTLASQLLDEAQAEDQRAADYLSLLDEGERVGLQDGACPLCASRVSDDAFMAAIKAARALLSTRSPKAQSAKLSLDEAFRKERDITQALRADSEELLRMETAQQSATRAHDELASRFQALGLGSVDDPESSEAMLRKHQERAALLEQALGTLETSAFTERVAQASARVEQRRALVEEESLRLSQAELALDRAKQIENLAKTVRNELLSEQLDTVLPLLKELYVRLRPHADWREIEIDVGGQVRASLNLLVGNGQNPQFLFSSGQRRAAGLAFLLALFLARPWCGLSTLLMDDPVQHEDDYRALNLVEVLASIRQSGRQVIISVEDSALADVLCRRLRSNVAQPGKRFELEVDVNGSAGIAVEHDIALMSNEVLSLAHAS